MRSNPASVYGSSRVLGNARSTIIIIYIFNSSILENRGHAYVYVQIKGAPPDDAICLTSR